MKHLTSWLLGAALLAFAQTSSAGLAPYTDQAFKDATTAGKTVVLDVHADWCPTCRRQQPALKKLIDNEPYKNVEVLVVDYDAQADVRQHFKVARQSTLVVFKGATETGRATGITEPEQISQLLDTARP